MASALMRRSVLTAALAAIATVASPLATAAFAADPALTAPTYSPGCNAITGACTSTANQPTLTASYNTALDPKSTASIVDTSSGSAAVPCTKAVTNDTANSTFTLSCTPTHDLVDGHVYKVTFSASNADDSSTKTTTNNWTEDIPSFKSSSPADGDVVGSGTTTVKATYDEALDPSSTITITDKDGNALTGGSLSASSPLPGSPKDTVSFTPGSNGQGLPDGTYFVNVHAVSGADPAHGYADTAFNYTVNATTPQAAPSVTTAGYQATDGSHWINGANESAVPFSGTAEPNVRVKVVIYDPNTSPHAPACSKGSCPNDRTANVGVLPCASPTTVNGVHECPWSLIVNTATNNGTPDQSGYKWFAVAYTAGGSSSTAESVIGKDTRAPAAPTGGSETSANPVGNDNQLTVKTSDTDTSVDSYRFVAVDAIGRTSVADFVTVAAHSCSSTLNPPKCVQETYDVGALQDGEDDYGSTPETGTPVGSSVAPGLVVNVYARDLAGNLSNKTSTSADKESTAFAPDMSKSYLTLVDGSTVPLGQLSPSHPVVRPKSVTVGFNELIRSDATSDAFFGDVAMSTNLSVLSHNGFPVSGTPSITDGGFSLTWTFNAPATDSGSPYSITNLKAVAGSCPDDGVDLSQQTPSAGNGYCEHYQSSSPLASFAIDTSAPKVHITGVNAAGLNNGVNADNIKSTVISGTVDPDAASISLAIKSSGGGGTRIIPGPAGSGESVTITSPAQGQSLATWTTSGLNLSTIPDGTLTIVATAIDGAGNKQAGANSSDPDAAITSLMGARPSAPQNLNAAAGNGQAVLVWSPPASTGAADRPITSYSLTYQDTSVPGSGILTAPSPSGTANSAVVGNLANGHTYTFRLAASNFDSGKAFQGGNGQAATKSATPKGNTTMSETASPGIITYGQAFTLSGSLTYFGVGLGGQVVQITSKYYNGATGPHYTVTTDANGHWVKAGIKPGRKLLFTARFAGNGSYNASSHALWERVRAAIKVTKVSAASSSHTSRVTLSGTVRPSERGYRVYIYEIRSGKLVKIGTVTLNSKSNWTFVHTFSKGKHLVVAKIFAHVGLEANQTGRVKIVRT